jgi:hypothetical protein
MSTASTETAKPVKAGREPFESKLGEGRQKFLAHAIEHGLSHGRRTPEDFLRHFPPSAIMQGLRDQPQLRANILVIATGVRSKIALKKPAESCGNDLAIALEEGETDAETVVTLFDPDDRVRYLEAPALWAYVTEGAFWQIDAAKDRPRHAVAAEHIAFLIDRALKDRVANHRDVVDGLSVAKLAELLPRTELEKLITAALKAGSGNKPYTEANLMTAIPATTLVQHIPLPWIWDHVVVPKIAEVHGFVAKAAPVPLVVAPPSPIAAAPLVPAPAPAAVPPPAADETLAGLEASLDLEIDDVLGDAPVAVAKKR